MTSPTPRTLLTLPTEVLKSILPRISQRDLTRCVRVSRAWHKTLVPYLWRILDIYSNATWRKFATDEAQRALRRNADLVRELNIAHKHMYDRFLPARQALISDPGVIRIEVFAISLFSNLDSLELHSINSWNQKTILSKSILTLVRQNPRLRRLRIDINIDPNIFMSIVVKYLPALQDLNLSTPWKGDVGALLENLPEGIQTVRLGNVIHVAPYNAQNSKSSVESGVATTMVRHHHCLKSLHIDGNLDGQEEEVLLPFLASCSRNFTSVGGMVAWFLGSARIASALTDLGVKRMELNWSSLPQNLSDADIAKDISSSPSWTRIRLLNIGSVGPLTAAAIVENCERLEALALLSGAGGLTGSHLQAVLSKATRLRSLQAHWLLHADKITAMNILSSEWATTSLEYMDLKIDVPRADEALPDNST
ncbi:hypothetical protein BG003_001982, partial [Podila horticola]